MIAIPIWKSVTNIMLHVTYETLSRASFSACLRESAMAVLRNGFRPL